MRDERIGVLLVDRHRSYRLALLHAFNFDTELTIHSHCGTVSEAADLFAEHAHIFDVVLCELDLPDGDPRSLIRNRGARTSRTQFIALTGVDDRWQWAQAMANGFAGVLSKDCALEDIRTAICRAGRGQPVHEPEELVEMLRLVSERQENERAALELSARLTPRERDILAQLATGASDKEIAEAVGISTNTVAAHMVHILRKMGVHSRLQAVLLALRFGMVHLDA